MGREIEISAFSPPAGAHRAASGIRESGSNWRNLGSPRLAGLDVVSSDDSQALRLSASPFGHGSHPAHNSLERLIAHSKTMLRNVTREVHGHSGLARFGPRDGRILSTSGKRFPLMLICEGETDGFETL
jgi:hypothetical protein